MVGQCEKSWDKGFDAVVHPLLRCFRHAHHGGPASLCVARHAWKRIDHLHVMAEVPEELRVVLHENAPRGIPWNGIKQGNDENLNEQPSSIERLMNFSEVRDHACSIVKQPRTNHAVGDAPVSQHGDVMGFDATINLDLDGASTAGDLLYDGC